MKTMIVEQVRQTNSISEMREEINRMAMHDALTRLVMDIASMEKMNDEDRCTLLAYHLLMSRQQHIEQAMRMMASGKWESDNEK